MLKGISSQKLLLAALVCPLVAILVLGSAILAFTPRPEVVEANVWPQSVDLVESLHIEAILSAKAQVAGGNASQSDLDDRRARTDDLLERWANIGLDSGQLEVQLDAVRIEDDERAVPESSELLMLADNVRTSAEFASPAVGNVEDLLGAARADASVAAQGAGVATLTTPAKAQRTRIAGMVAVSEIVTDAALPPDSGNLGSVLSETATLYDALVDGEAVTIDQWTDGHIERQRAMAEVARAYAFAGSPVIAGDDPFPIIPLAVAAGAGLLAIGVFGTWLFARLNTGAAVLERRMLAFAKQTMPDAASEAELRLSDQIEPVVLSGDLRRVSEAFNEVQQTAAYILDQEREDHEFVTDRVFQSVAQRNRVTLVEQLDILDSLAVEETDLGKLEQLAQLDTRMRRMQRDVVSFGALGGESPPILHEDRALSELIELAVEETRGADRVRILTTGNISASSVSASTVSAKGGSADSDSAKRVLVDGDCAADVAHIITELMENALHSSPSESLVEVLCNQTDRDSLMISISDEGHGMDPEEMEGLNQVLSSPSRLKPETAGTLGVVAIAAIAWRSEIDVRFTDSPAGGVTALVTVPAEMVSPMPDDWTPTTRLVTQARLTEGRLIAAETVGARGVDPDLVAVKTESFDRELPVAEFEYDLDPDASSASVRAEMRADAMPPEASGSDLDFTEESFGLDDDLIGLDDDAGSTDAFEDVELDQEPSFDAEVPLSEVDYDESPFAAATDDDLEERSGAEMLGELNKRPVVPPVDGFGPKKRAKNGSPKEGRPSAEPVVEEVVPEVAVDEEAAEEVVAEVVEEVVEEVVVEEPEIEELLEVESKPEGPFIETISAEETNSESAVVAEADDVDRPAEQSPFASDPFESSSHDDDDENDQDEDDDQNQDLEDVALPTPAADNVELGPTYDAEERSAPSSYTALDSLLANLPERVEEHDAETAESARSTDAKLAITRRVPTSSSSISPSELNGTPQPSASTGPKTPDEVREMLAKYRSGRND